MVDFRRQFSSAIHPEIKKLSVINPTIQTDINDFRSQTSRGANNIQSYAPQNLDLIRWKLGRYWTNQGDWSYTLDEWGNIGNAPNTIWKFVTSTTEPCGSPNAPCAQGEKKELIKVERNIRYGLIDSNNPPNGDAAWLWVVDSDQNTYYSPEEVSQGAPSFAGQQGVSVFGNPSVGVRGKVFYDHVCELEIPHKKKTIDNVEFGSVRVAYEEIKSFYNFYVGSYECIIDEPAVDERVLPNLYAFLLVQQSTDNVIVKNDPSSIDTVFEQNVTLNKRISGSLFATDANGVALTETTLADMRNKGKSLGKASSEGQYFDKYANNYYGFGNNTSDQAYTKKLTNLVVPMSDLNLYKDFNEKKFNFPMAVDVSFSTDVNTQFATALKDSRLSSLFASSIITGSERAAGELDYGDPSFDIRNKLDFDRSIYTEEYYRTATSDQKRPVAWVWFGRKDVPGPNPWGTTGGIWTPISNLEHVSYEDINRGIEAEGDNSFFVGDTVIIKRGARSGGQERLDQVGQIIGYTSHGRPELTTIAPGNWVPFLDRGVSFPEDVSKLRNKESAIDNIQAFEVYGTQTDIQSQRPQYKRKGNYILSNQPDKDKTTAELKQWDITKWIDTLATDPTYGNHDMSEITYLGPYSQEIQEAQAQGSQNFLRTLLTVILAGKFQQLVDEKTRTFAQILDGKKAYSETVFYKVEKWALNNAGDETGSKPIQSFYLPNSNDVDVHRYIDTQIKYGKKYRYKVFAYQAVFGTRYRYVLNRVPDTVEVPGSSDAGNGSIGTGVIDAGQAEICVFTAPSVRLIEVPYTDQDVVIMDSPPIWPDVNILPYMKKNNQVLFLFQGNVGNYRLDPINVLRDDYDEVLKLREAQDIFRGPIEYKSDDQARKFEVFRTPIAPTTYQDFSNWKMGEVETDAANPLQPLKAATSAGFVDSIVPNTKYYYMFRSVDVHGHTSNPSPVYEVEISDNGGAPVLLTQVHPLIRHKEPPQAPSKCAKKYIYITPNTSQLQLNRQESGLIDLATGGKVSEIPEGTKPALGLTEEVVWGKKFKIRLVSKKTGKKIDFKVEFKTEHEEATNQGSLQGQKIC